MNYRKVRREAVFARLTRGLRRHGRLLRRHSQRAWGRTLGLWDCLEDRALLAAPTIGLISENYAATDSAAVGAFSSSISANGQYVAFESGSYQGTVTPAPSDLVKGLTVQNDAPNVYIRDVATNTTTCISLDISATTPTTGNDDSRYPIISANGNTVVFLSNANDLTANDNPSNNPNDNQNVFVWSRATNKVTLVTVNYEGTAPANDPDTSTHIGTLENISVSANGRYVTYDSEATDLVPNATSISGFTANVYVRDLLNNTTILVSASTAGADSGGDGPSNEPVISTDGSTVAFVSEANNLDPSYTGLEPFDNYQVYVSTLGSSDTVSSTKLASVDPTGTTVGNGTSAFPSVSDNGQMLAFQSSATNLVIIPLEGGAFNDDYVRNLATNTTQLVSVNQTGTTDGDSSSFAPQISGDGDHILFYSLADDLTPNNTDGHTNVFERNLTTNTTQLVSVTDTGNGGDDTSTLANTHDVFGNASQQATGQISDNGQYVIFISLATDLVANFVQENGGAPFGEDVYLRDTVAGTTTLVSHALGKAATGGTGESGTASITPDGSNIAFESGFPAKIDNLVSNDTHNQTQLFDAAWSSAVATAIEATAGTPQSVTVNTTFATALQATVTDQNGKPLGGATVTFAAPTSGASGTFPGGFTSVMVTTNASGVATAPAFAANAAAGVYTVTASVGGVATPASFRLTNDSTSGAVTTDITAVSGTGTYGGSATLTSTLTANGAGLAGKSVAFTLDINGAITPAGSAMTNANGVARLSGVSLAGLGAGTDTGAVGANFAGDATDAASNGSGTLTVNSAHLTVTVQPASRSYGQPNPTFTVRYSGFVSGQGPGVLSGVLSFNTKATPSSNVGSYPLAAGGLSSPNYVISYVPSTLTISPETLTFTAVSTSRKFKAANPNFTFTDTGFVLGQTANKVFKGAPALSTTATKSSPRGQYLIAISKGTLVLLNNNYALRFVTGILRVT